MLVRVLTFGVRIEKVGGRSGLVGSEVGTPRRAGAVGQLQRTSERPERTFDGVRTVIAETGLLRGKVCRALDSTVLDDAVTTQDTVTQLIATTRRVRRPLPAVAGLELRAHDPSDPNKSRRAWDDDDARNPLVSGLVNDAFNVLDAVDGTGLDPAATEAVGFLALVAGDDVEPSDEQGSGRIAQRTTKLRLIPTVNPDNRHLPKDRRMYRNVDKAHVVGEPTTALICGQRISAGDAPDGPTGVEFIEHAFTARQVLADSTYGSGETRTV